MSGGKRPRIATMVNPLAGGTFAGGDRLNGDTREARNPRQAARLSDSDLRDNVPDQNCMASRSGVGPGREGTVCWRGSTTFGALVLDDRAWFRPHLPKTIADAMLERGAPVGLNAGQRLRHLFFWRGRGLIGRRFSRFSSEDHLLETLGGLAAGASDQGAQAPRLEGVPTLLPRLTATAKAGTTASRPSTQGRPCAFHHRWAARSRLRLHAAQRPRSPCACKRFWHDAPPDDRRPSPLTGTHFCRPRKRPVQVNDRFAGVLAGPMPNVRKDMRARYPPLNPWPESYPTQADPNAAGQATRAPKLQVLSRRGQQDQQPPAIAQFFEQRIDNLPRIIRG